jgi:hypothetical protein
VTKDRETAQQDAVEARGECNATGELDRLIRGVPVKIWMEQCDDGRVILLLADDEVFVPLDRLPVGPVARDSLNAWARECLRDAHREEQP